MPFRVAAALMVGLQLVCPYRVRAASFRSRAAKEGVRKLILAHPDFAGLKLASAPPTAGLRGSTLSLAAAAVPEAGLGAELKRRLVEEWRRALGELSSTREHAKFLADQGVSIQFPETIGNLINGEFIASYEPDGVHVGEAVFARMAAGLRAQGVRDGELPRALALKTLGVLGHEIRHGINAYALRTEFGIDFQAGSVEDEILAHYDQLRILEEVEANNPLLWWDGYDIPVVDGVYNELRRAWAGGSAGLEYYIRNKPPMLNSILSGGREETAGRFRGYAEMIEKSLVRMGARAAEIRAVPEARRSAEENELLEKITRNTASFKANLKKIAATLEAVDDPAKFENMRNFYRERISEIPS